MDTSPSRVSHQLNLPDEVHRKDSTFRRHPHSTMHVYWTTVKIDFMSKVDTEQWRLAMTKS